MRRCSPWVLMLGFASLGACNFVPGHPSGDADVHLICDGDDIETVDITPQLQGLATCAFEEGHGLFVEVGSNDCSSIQVQLVDFSGPGVYTIDPMDEEGSWMRLALFAPNTGCDPLGAAASQRLNDICNVPPSCEVRVEGVAPGQPGDLEMTVTCDEMMWVDRTWNDDRACGTCRPTRPLRVEVRDCDLESYLNGGTIQPPT